MTGLITPALDGFLTFGLGHGPGGGVAHAGPTRLIATARVLGLDPTRTTLYVFAAASSGGEINGFALGDAPGAIAAPERLDPTRTTAQDR